MNINRIFATLSCVVVFVSAIADDFENSGVKYRTTSDSTCKIIGDTDNNIFDVWIPEKVAYNGKEYLVTEIGESAFEGFSNLHCVYSSDRTRVIGKRAFADCANLLWISDNGAGLWDVNGDYHDRMSFPPDLEIIGDEAFYGCTNLQNPRFFNSLTTIGKSAFEKCSNLTFVYLPPLVSKIPANAFKDCSNLKYVTTPSRLTDIGANAFYGCDKSLQLNISAPLPPKCDATAFDADTYSNADVRVLSVSINSFKSADVWKSFAKLQTPPNKTDRPWVDYNGRTLALRGDWEDETEYWYTVDGSDPSNVNNKARKLFDKRFDIGDLMSTNLADSLFIRAVAVNPGKDISEEMDRWWARYYSTETKLIMKDAYCLGEAFNWANDEVRATIKNMTVYGKLDVWSDLYSVRYVFSNNLETFDMSNVSDMIGSTVYEGAFEGKSKLTSVVFPDNNELWGIGSNAFSGCTSLKSITIPNSVRNLDNYAFKDCKSLTSLVLPTNIENLSRGTFSGCENLKDVYIGNINPPTCYGGAFDENHYKSTTLHVPQASVFKYNESEGDWRFFEKFANLPASTLKPEFSYNGRDMTFYVPNEPNAEIYYTTDGRDPHIYGEKYEWPVNLYDAYFYNGKRIRAAARVGMTGLGESVEQSISYFSNEYSTGEFEIYLTEVGTMAKSLAWLEDKSWPVRMYVHGPMNQSDFDVFRNMTKLSYVNLKESSIANGIIPDNAFKGLPLTKVELPDYINTIGANAFQGCELLRYVQHYDERYEWNPSLGYDELIPEHVSLPASLTTIGANAFDGCADFMTLTTMPSGLTSVGAAAFRNCKSFESILIPKTISTIESNTYYGCTGISSIAIPLSITSIGSAAFGGCSNVTEVSAISVSPATCADASVFDASVYTNATLLVSRLAGNAYSTANVWSKFANASVAKATVTPRVFVNTDVWNYQNNDYDGRYLKFSVANGNDPDFWYTIDGSDPTDMQNGKRVRYTKPFDIGEYMVKAGLDGSVNIRFAAQASGLDVSEVASWSPTYYANDTIVLTKEMEKVRFAYQWVRDNDTLKDNIKYLKIIGNMTYDDFGCVREYFSNGLETIDLTNAVLVSKTDPHLPGSSYSGMKLKSVLLPEYLVRIDDQVFENCESLTSIIIPDNVNTIRNRVFSGCTNLKNVKMPESLRELGTPWDSDYRGSVFKNCASLERIVIPDGVNIIHASTFEGCTNLKEVVLPAEMTEFGTAGYYEEEGNVFKGCKNLKSVSIPIKTTCIPANTFYGCESLEVVKMSSSIEYIDQSAFAGCNAIKEVHMLRDTPPTFMGDEKTGTVAFESPVYANATLKVLNSTKDAYASSDYWRKFTKVEAAGASDKAMFNFDGHYMRLYGTNPNYEFYYTLDGSDPSDVTNTSRQHYEWPIDMGDTIKIRAIARDAYLDFGEVSETTPPCYMRRTWGEFEQDNYCDYYELLVREPGSLKIAFNWLSEKNDNYDEKPTSVGELKIVGKGSLTTEDFSAIKKLTNLERLIINGIKEDGHVIPASAFENMAKLQKVVIPTTITVIEDKAFAGCTALSSINALNNLTKIGNSAFEKCTRLSSFNIPSTLTSLGAGAFNGCLYLSSIKIPNGVTTIGDNTFKGCSNLTTLSLPEGITSIGVSAFENCIRLKSIDIPEEITSVPRRAYYGCVALESKIEVSDKVTAIGDSAFFGCSKVSEIYARSFTPTPLGVDAFAGIDPAKTTLFVSKSVKDAYAAADGWKAFTNYDWLDPCSPAKVVFDGRYLTFETETKKPVIFFTLDGSEPVEGESLMFTEPYDVGKCSVEVRMLVTKPNVEPSSLSSGFIHYYFDGETATVDTIGVLHKAFDWCEPSSVENLTIKTINNGKLSSTELTTLHKDLLKNLSYLDISEAEVEGNTLPDNAFEGAALIHASLPKTLTSAGSSIFKDCNELAAVTWNAEAAMPDNVMNGVTNPNLLFYAMNKSYVPSSITKNIVVNAQSDNVVLCDVESGNNNFYCPTSFTASNISYTHNYTLETKSSQSAGWETISLPFTVQSIAHEKNGAIAPFAANKPYDQARPFWLNSLTENGFVPAAEIKANTPYIISMPHNEIYATSYDQGGNVTFSAKNATVAKTVQNYSTYGDISLIPTTMMVAKSESVLAINREKKSSRELPGSVFVADDRDVRPFEAYAIAEAVLGNAPAVVSLSQFGGTTDIEDIMLATGRQFKIYVVDGVLYISSDVRQTVRIFNASGALVREVDVHAGENPVQGLTSGMYVVGDNKIAL